MLQRPSIFCKHSSHSPRENSLTRSCLHQRGRHFLKVDLGLGGNAGVNLEGIFKGAQEIEPFSVLDVPDVVISRVA